MHPREIEISKLKDNLSTREVIEQVWHELKRVVSLKSLQNIHKNAINVDWFIMLALDYCWNYPLDFVITIKYRNQLIDYLKNNLEIAKINLNNKEEK